MSSEEKVLAIRPEAMCLIYWYPEQYLIVDTKELLSGYYNGSEPEAWAAAYKYLTK